MNDDHVAVRCGPVSLTESQLSDVVRRVGTERRFVPGRLVPIVERDRIQSLIVALAARASGAIPLLGDDRWDAQFWAELQVLADGADDAVVAPDTAWAAFSSGSSGTPRVILRSEHSWSASFPAVTELMELTSVDSVYLPAPLSSSLSLFSVAHSRSVGAGIVLPSGHSVSSADLEHATVLHGTPQALRAVVESIEGGAIRHRLRMALVGGAQLDASLQERAETLGIRVVSYYGAAELSFVAVDIDGRGHRPFPGAQLRIDAGELWVRSPYTASGYLGAAGALRRDAQSWSTVGDLVDGDPLGPLRFRGRKDGAILTAAATVVPEDVEAALRTIDGIEDAVVFGLPNAGVGNLVGAVLETTTGRALPSVRELREQAGTRLAPSHLPRRWFWTERLPRTAAGKPARALIQHDVVNGKVTRLD